MSEITEKAIEAARDACNDSYGDVDKTIAAYEAALWQPIETADPNGGKILIQTVSGKIHIAHFDEHKHRQNPRPFWNYDFHRPTVCREDPAVWWQPLPAQKVAP